MDTMLIIGLVFMVLGVVGSVVPVMPGPILSFVGLALLYAGKPDSISVFSLAIFGLVMALLIVADYVAPILGAKFSGASRKGLFGAVVGCFVGIVFFPPIGMFLGAFVGAIIGEMADGKESAQAVKAGIGTLIGSLFMIILQTVFAIFSTVYFLVKLF